MSNSLDPDQAKLSVGPDLGPNCLQKLSATLRDKELTLILKLIFCLEKVVCFLHLLHTCIYSNTLQTTFDHGIKHYGTRYRSFLISYIRKYFSWEDPEGGTGRPDPPPPPPRKSQVGIGFLGNSGADLPPEVFGPLWSNYFSREIGTAL